MYNYNEFFYRSFLIISSFQSFVYKCYFDLWLCRSITVYYGHFVLYWIIVLFIRVMLVRSTHAVKGNYLLTYLLALPISLKYRLNIIWAQESVVMYRTVASAVLCSFRAVFCWFYNINVLIAFMVELVNIMCIHFYRTLITLISIYVLEKIAECFLTFKTFSSFNYSIV